MSTIRGRGIPSMRWRPPRPRGVPRMKGRHSMTLEPKPIRTVTPGSVTTPGSMTQELLAHAGFLRHLALDLVGDGAADLVQETYRVALEHPPQQAGPLRGWLATVAANLARNLRRSEHRRTAREENAARAERLEPDKLALER